MTRRSTPGVSFQLLAILTFAMMVWTTSAFAQDDILGELTSEQENTSTQVSDGNQPTDAELAEQATTVNSQQTPEVEAGDGSDPETAANQESAESTTDGNDTQDSDDQAEAVVSDESGAIEQFLNSGALGLLLNGGAFMWPILLMGILAVGVIIERYRSLKMLNADDQQVREQVQQLLFDEKIEEALELCDTQHGPVPAVLSAGLRKYYVLRKLDYDVARTEEQVVKAMDDYSVHIVAELERHLPVLATVSSAAPMLGFLGTVQGMIVAFQQIVEQMGETNIVEAAASGIQVSLLTTCFGLIVGIPAFVAFNYFTSVINRFVLQVEQSATELIENVSIQLAAAGMDGSDDSRAS